MISVLSDTGRLEVSAGPQRAGDEMSRFLKLISGVETKGGCDRGSIHQSSSGDATEAHSPPADGSGRTAGKGQGLMTRGVN